MENTSRDSMAALPKALEFPQRNGPSHHADRVRPRAALRVVPSETVQDLDHFVERDGLRFTGTHLIIDLWQASGLDQVEAALRSAVQTAGATLVNVDLHRFTPNGGITGVAMLTESHISIQTWPECAYAAVDVFMCGDAELH